MKTVRSKVLMLLMIPCCLFISSVFGEENKNAGDKPGKQDVIKDVEHVVIFREEELFAHGPTLATDPETGFLYTSFTVRIARTHYSTLDDYRVQMESRDGGLTWQEITEKPSSVLDHRPGLSNEWWDGDIGPGGAFTAPDGALIRIGSNMRRWVPIELLPRYEGRYYITMGAENRGPGPDYFAFTSGGYLERSEDGGRTWQRTPIPELDIYWSMSQRWNYTQLPDGRVLRAFTVSHGGDNLEHVYQKAQVVAVLTRDGLTHEVHHVMGGTYDGHLLFTEETQVHVTSKGVIWMLTRVHDMDRERGENNLWQAVSVDGGRKWTSRSTDINIGRSPASGLVQLNDGRLLMVAGHRRSPRGIHAFLSDDEGLTWGPDLVIRDDGGGSLGYPRALQLEDGTVVTIYWYTTIDDAAKKYPQNIRLTRFRVR